MQLCHFPRLPILISAYCGAVASHPQLPSEADAALAESGEVSSGGAMATLHGNGRIAQTVTCDSLPKARSPGLMLNRDSHDPTSKAAG